MTTTDRPAADRRAPEHHGGTFAFRLGWGREGLRWLAPACDVIVVVDVLRFSSAVSAAIEAGASVAPERSGERHADAPTGFAAAPEAPLAPAHLLRSRPGERFVLRSPNGAALAVEAAELGAPFVLAGCLRNATATARRAELLAHGGAIGVVAAGERWPGHESRLRPAVEDLIGAGAILHALDPAASVSAPCCDPEARAARAAFVDARPSLPGLLAATASGQELIERGDGDDVEASAALDATDLAAQLVEGAFVGV